MEKPNHHQTASRENPAAPAKRLNTQTDELAEAHSTAAYEQKLRPLWATFRNILLVVFLIFVFAIVQMLMLKRVCNTGMETAASLEQEGLPTLNNLASLHEHLAIYRLNAYECLFAQKEEKAVKAKAVQNTAAETRAELEIIKMILPGGKGRQLAADLENAFADLDTEFRKVQNLVDSDFAAAMKLMDQDIPLRTQRVAAAANALSDFGYRFSGGQAKATFDSFGWIRKNAILFGATNICVAFGAVMFVLLAARRSRVQLSQTLARLNERTQELAQSFSLLNATLESTADGILVVDGKMQVTSFNSKFLKMWQLPRELLTAGTDDKIQTLAAEQLKNGTAFLAKVQELYGKPEAESHDILELKDGRTFERDSKPQRLNAECVGRVWSFRDITERKRAEVKLENVHKQLVEVSRQGGMAEIATNVLHNVGNVLNSVNVSASLVVDKVKKSRIANLAKIVALLREQKDDLGTFITSDARGKQLPTYLSQLSEHLLADQKINLQELELLLKHIEHIKEIVTMQQSYAQVSGVKEVIDLQELVEDSLRMSESALNRHGVEIIREFEAVPPINFEKHKILQILVNLIRNAKHACQDSGRDDKHLTVRIASSDGWIKLSVSDNGVGILPENLTRVFNHGFTTRKDGHGFGLHSGALAAKQLGGTLTVDSDGPDQGATFTLELPCTPNLEAHE